RGPAGWEDTAVGDSPWCEYVQNRVVAGAHCGTLPSNSLHALGALLKGPLNRDELRHGARGVADELNLKVAVADEETGLGLREKRQRGCSGRLQDQSSAVDPGGHLLTVGGLVLADVTRDH